MRKLALIVAVAGMVFAGTAAEATTVDLQAAAMAEPSQTYHWRFEGADVSTSGLDYEVSVNNLVESVHGANELVYDAPGFDATSTGASTYRGIPGGDHSNGGDGFLTSANITPGTTFSWEVVLQTGEVPIDGGTWDLGYVLSHRPGYGPRGYFLWQGTSTSGSGDGFTSLTGDWITSEATVVPAPLPENNWYYMAGTYTVNPGDGTSQVDLYYADLTAGDTSLTHTAFANPKAYDYGTPGIFGVGTRFDNVEEAFPGVLDEVYLYESALPQQTLQAHLDALLGGGVVVPEPATLALVGLGMLGLAIRRRS